MTTTLSCVTIDCVESGSLAKFWAAVLGWEIVYDDADGAALQQADGSAPTLYLQPVPEPKSGKNRAHLDLATGDYEADLHRLFELGAVEVQVGAGPGARRSMVLADPQGNEFCLRRVDRILWSDSVTRMLSSGGRLGFREAPCLRHLAR